MEAYKKSAERSPEAIKDKSTQRKGRKKGGRSTKEKGERKLTHQKRKRYLRGGENLGLQGKSPKDAAN